MGAFDLRKAVSSALADLQRIETLGSKGQLAQELAEAFAVVEPARKQLDAAVSTARALHDSGVVTDASYAEVTRKAEKVAPRLEKYRERLRRTPPEAKGGRDLTLLLKSVRTVVEVATEVSTEAWTSHRTPLLMRAEDALRLAAEGQDEIVSDLDDALERLRVVRQPPTESEALKAHEALLKEVQDLTERVRVVEVPEKVAAFLKAAERPQGAQFRMLAPEVYEWIRGQAEIRDTLKIRRG